MRKKAVSRILASALLILVVVAGIMVFSQFIFDVIDKDKLSKQMEINLTIDRSPGFKSLVTVVSWTPRGDKLDVLVESYEDADCITYTIITDSGTCIVSQENIIRAGETISFSVSLDSCSGTVSNVYAFANDECGSGVEAKFPLVHYEFEGNTNDSASGLDARVEGNPDFVKGVLGQGLHFNGSDNLFLGNMLTNELKNSFTISSWVKLDEVAVVDGANSYLFHKYDDRPGIRFQGRGGYANAVFHHMTNGTGSIHTGTIYPNEWYHIAYVFDGGYFRPYINGVAQTISQNRGYIPGSGINIGRDEKSLSWNRYFKGTIDEFKIWSVALSGQEVLEEFDSYTFDDDDLFWVGSNYSRSKIISNCQELSSIRNNLTASYILVNDIDCSDSVNWNNGAGFPPIWGSFGGVLDGQGYKVKGIYMNRPDGKWFGLFGNIDGGVVKNLHIVEANVSGDGTFGILAGSFANGVIDGVSVRGVLNLKKTLLSSDSKSGGLVGYVLSGNATIRNSWTEVVVNAENRRQVGGLVGYHRGRGSSETPLIENSYSISQINGGSSKVGILVGDNDEAIIRNSYGVGNKRVIGFNYDSWLSPKKPIQENVFCDVEVFSGCAAYSGILSRTTSEMEGSEIFVNSGWTSPPWVFGRGYPLLFLEDFSGQTIEIDSCQALDKFGARYTLTRDLLDEEVTPDCIKITRNKVFFDCQGHLIKNAELDGRAIVSFSDDVIVANCDITVSGKETNHLSNKGVGIYVGGERNILETNFISDSFYGVFAENSNNLILNHNHFENNSNSVYLEGVKGSLSQNNLIRRGLNNQGIGFLVNAGENNSFINNNIINSNQGFFFNNSENSFLNCNLFTNLSINKSYYPANFGFSENLDVGCDNLNYSWNTSLGFYDSFLDYSGISLYRNVSYFEGFNLESIHSSFGENESYSIFMSRSRPATLDIGESGKCPYGEYMTVGISKEDLSNLIPRGRVITKARVIIEGANRAPESIYLIDNPLYGYAKSDHKFRSDPFKKYSKNLTELPIPSPSRGRITIILENIPDDPNSWVCDFFGCPFYQNGVRIPAVILELIDYVGTGPSFGFGFYGGADEVFSYNKITVQIITEDYMTDPERLLDPRTHNFVLYGKEDCINACCTPNCLKAGETRIPGDINWDGCVNSQDLLLFAENWLSGCPGSPYQCNVENCYCGGTDINKDGCVNLNDYNLICQNWLKCS